MELGSSFPKTNTIGNHKMLWLFKAVHKYLHVLLTLLEPFHIKFVSLLRLSLSTPPSLILKTQDGLGYREAL